MRCCNVLCNVAPVLFSSFVIPDLLCGFSRLNICDIIFIPDNQPPSAPALVIFDSSDLCRQIVHKEQRRRASKSVEPLFFVYFLLDYYECVLFFSQKCGFFKLPQFLYTHLLTLVLLTNNNFRVSSLYMFFVMQRDYKIHNRLGADIFEALRLYSGNICGIMFLSM